MSYGYALMYDWSFESPVNLVWDLIAKAEERGSWWPAVKQASLLAPGDANGLGAVHRIAWRAPLAIPLRFETKVMHVERHRALKSIALGGFFIEESWYFFPEMRGTAVRHAWMITFTQAWMQLIPRFGDRIVGAYSKAMAGGFEGA